MEDIFYLIRDGNETAVRSWLDSADNDINLTLETSSSNHIYLKYIYIKSLQFLYIYIVTITGSVCFTGRAGTAG